MIETGTSQQLQSVAWLHLCFLKLKCTTARALPKLPPSKAYKNIISVVQPHPVEGHPWSLGFGGYFTMKFPCSLQSPSTTINRDDLAALGEHKIRGWGEEFSTYLSRSHYECEVSFPPLTLCHSGLQKNGNNKPRCPSGMQIQHANHCQSYTKFQKLYCNRKIQTQIWEDGERNLWHSTNLLNLSSAIYRDQKLHTKLFAEDVKIRSFYEVLYRVCQKAFGSQSFLFYD